MRPTLFTQCILCGSKYNGGGGGGGRGGYFSEYSCFEFHEFHDFHHTRSDYNAEAKTKPESI